MALVLKDRVKEGTTTTGTGDLTLAGASARFDSFNAYMVNGDTTYYAIAHTGTGIDEWEVGLGTWNTGNTLSRTTVINGSNGTSPVNFSAGSKDVFMTYPASIAAYTDGSGDLSSLIGLGNHTTEIFDAIKTVDGAGSGLDADLLDGIQASSFLQSNQTITLSGDATGSGTTSIVVTVADDSHNHIISNVDGLQAALDGKASTSHNHTLDSLSNTTITSNTSGEILKWNGTAWVNNTLAEAGIQPAGSYLTGNQTITLSGDATGSGTTSIVVTVADDSHNHIISNVDGLQTALDAKLDDTQKGAANGLAELDATGKVPSAQLPSYVDDVLEYAAEANFPVTGEAGKLYVALDTNDVYRWTGSVYVKVSDAVSTADQATKLTTARNIALTGDVTGNANFDGSTNITISATVADDSHNHIISNVDGLQTALDGKSDTTHTHTGVYEPADSTILKDADIGVTVQGYSAVLAGTTASFTTADETKLDGIEANATADQTATEILTAIKTVDGTGSGLDADLLDGNEASAFYLASNPSGYTTNTGTVTSVTQTVPTGFTVTGSPITTSGTLAVAYDTGYQGYTTAEASKLSGIETGATADQTASEILTAIKTVDGAGSGLDADLLDGNEASAFYLASNPSGYTTNTGTVASVAATVPVGFTVSGSPVTTSGTLAVAYDTGYQGYTTTEASKLSGIEAGATADQTAAEILTAIKTVDGAGSGLDADLLDGNEASAFYLASNPSGYTTNTGTVTSVAATVPVGFTVTGSPVTTTGTLAVAYDTGYQGYTTTEASKLSGIEAGADVTDAANVEPLVDTHLNTGTAAAGEVLSWTGTDYDWITAGGGSVLYAENPVTPTAPSATGNNAVAIGNGAVAAGLRSVALGNSYAGSDDSFAAVIQNNTSSFGATQFYSVAIGKEAHASSVSSVAIGDSAKSSGTQAVAFNGSRASGIGSFAAQIQNNSTTYGAIGTDSIAIGAFAKTTASNSVAFGDSTQATNTWAYAMGRFCRSTSAYAVTMGYNCLASASYTVALGYQASATGWNAFAAGGSSTFSESATASGQGSVALGGAYATAKDSVSIGASSTTGTTIGKIAFSNDKFSANGDSQHGLFVLRSDTTDATPEALTTNTSSADTTNQIILPDNSAYAFHGTVVARQQASAGTASAAWKVEGLIRRENLAGTTVLVNSATTILDNTPAWGMALSADTTNGGLAITVTGAAATNIRWVATIHTSEVIY